MNRLTGVSAFPGTQGIRHSAFVHAGNVAPGRLAGLATLIAGALLLGACDTTNYAAKAEASTPAAPEVPTAIVIGSKLTLRVPLQLPAGGAPLMFQRNAIVNPATLANDAPFCRFTPAGSGAPRALKPATFTVRGIDYDERRSASGPRPVGVTHYRLAPEAKHPGYVLSCQYPEGAPPSAFVTSDDVMTAVSAFFAIDSVH